MDTKDLLPIGQFAQATGLSVTTLRHYDTAGVLPPAATDPATGYRYYARAQVGRAQLVRALRQLDVPVEQIRVLLDRHAEGADIIPELDTRVRAAAQRVRGQHVVLRGLIATLTEGEGMSPDINLSRRGAIHALACRASVDAAGLDAFARSAYRTLYTEAGKGPLFLPVPAFIRYHGPMTDDSTTEVEACLPYEPEATAPGEPAAGVHLVHQPETPFASTVVEGDGRRVAPHPVGLRRRSGLDLRPWLRLRRPRPGDLPPLGRGAGTPPQPDRGRLGRPRHDGLTALAVRDRRPRAAAARPPGWPVRTAPGWRRASTGGAM